MSVQSTDQTPQSGVILLVNMKKIASGGNISFMFMLLVEFGREHSSASFYRFNFGN